MIKKIGGLLVLVLGLALLVYSASRSVNFIQMTLPGDRQILAFFGLAALDGGIIAWELAYLYGARGWQRAISLLMTLIDVVGAIAMFTLDTLYQTGVEGMTKTLTGDEIQMAVLGLSGIIGLNFFATICYRLMDPTHLREAAEEEAFDKLDEEELRQIKEDAGQLAAEIAPLRSTAWQQRARVRYLGVSAAPTIVDGRAVDVPERPGVVGDESGSGLRWPWSKQTSPAQSATSQQQTNQSPTLTQSPTQSSAPQPAIDPAVLAAAVAAVLAEQAASRQNGNGHKSPLADAQAPGATG